MKYTDIIFGFLLITLLLGFSSCDDEKTADYDVPATYSFARNGENTVDFSGQTTRIQMAEELVLSLNDFSSTKDLLKQQFANTDAEGGDVDPYISIQLNASNKSVRSKVAASTDLFSSNTTESAKIKSDFDRWMESQVDEVFPNQMQLAAKGIAGQIADGTTERYVSGKGLEYNQAVAKGLVGALMTDQILNNYLSPAVLDAGTNREDNDAQITVDGQSYTAMEHNWDEAYGYLFGNAPDAANPIGNLGVDNFLNKYLGRVEDSEAFAGIATEIWDAYKSGRAAIVASAYDDRDKQADIIKAAISEVIAIRAVYYLQNGKIALEASDFGTAFHDLSEGYGFIYSLRFTRKPGSAESHFSRAEVDGFISTLEEGNGFWDIGSTTLDEMAEEIAAKFDFTVEQASK